MMETLKTRISSGMSDNGINCRFWFYTQPLHGKGDFVGRLTAKFIEQTARRLDKQQVIIRDDELLGLGLRVTKGSMSWIVEGRDHGAHRRITIGKYQLMSVEDARHAARLVHFHPMVTGFMT
jgi:hypothetical protein